LDKSHEHERDWVDVRFNSHPTQIYELTLTIHDAPGKLERGGDVIFYKSNTVECVPPDVLDKKNGGTLLEYYGTVPFDANLPNKKTSNIYKTYIARDLMVDEDYYNKGVCHWTLDYWKIYTFRATDKDNSIDFVSTIYGDEIESNQPVNTYFLKSAYADPPPDFTGKPLTEKEYLKMPEAERAKFFYTTITVKKVKPRPALQRWIYLKYTPEVDYKYDSNIK
jgi:hypothetical protein